MEETRRSKRQRASVDYSRLDTSGLTDSIRVQYKKLSRAVVKFVNQPQEEAFSVSTVAANELAAHVHTSGFGHPCVVRASDDARSALGIRVPKGDLTVDRVAELVGRNRQVHTIDVSTQSEGPVYTLDELATYFASPSPRKPLLNVVSLDLANTLLHDMVSAPSLVREVDLVNKAWPPSQTPAPMVQQYALLSVAGCFMDFHVDFGGSSVWYHVLSGSKVFLLVPPTELNLMAFEEWSSSARQASIFFADRATGCQKLELNAGDTLVLPGGWPHCVVTPEDSLVLGGNFLTGYNLPLQLNMDHMANGGEVESALQVSVPFLQTADVGYDLLNKKHMRVCRHTAAHYLAQLRPCTKVAAKKGRSSVSKWEKEGLVSLCTCLQTWLRQSKDGSDLPSGYRNPTKLVKELENLLKKEGIDVGAAVDFRTTAMPHLTLRPLSDERLVSQWPTLEEDEDCDEEIVPEVTDDGELDPSDEDDVDFAMKTKWSKRERTPATATKRPERKAVQAGLSGPGKLKVVLALPRIPSTLTNCGLDPRMPTPKARPKEDSC